MEMDCAAARPVSIKTSSRAADRIIGVYFWMIVRILNKAGYSGWWSLLMVVPLVNIVMVWVFAFSDWPALKARI